NTRPAGARISTGTAMGARRLKRLMIAEARLRAHRPKHAPARRGSAALEVAVQRPDVAGAQALKPDADAVLVVRPFLLDDPAHIARHLDGLGLRGELEAELHRGADRERGGRLEVQAPERDVPGLGDLLLPFELNFDLQL